VSNLKVALSLSLAVLIAMGIWFTRNYNAPAPVIPTPPVAEVPEQLPSFILKDIEGKTRNSSDWNGKILIVNYWATWCPPCREEMPALIELQNKYGPQGIQVIGIAVDNLDDVREFMNSYGVNFPVVVGGDDAIELGRRMGNRIAALPYTAIFDRSGKTLYAQPGKITLESLEQVVKPNL
jgi:thiol-disulfide isomerase/thioredoxin